MSRCSPAMPYVLAESWLAVFGVPDMGQSLQLCPFYPSAPTPGSPPQTSCCPLSSCPCSQLQPTSSSGVHLWGLLCSPSLPTYVLSRVERPGSCLRRPPQHGMRCPSAFLLNPISTSAPFGGVLSSPTPTPPGQQLTSNNSPLCLSWLFCL